MSLYVRSAMKSETKKCKQKQFLLLNFLNIFNILTAGTENIAW